MPTKPWVPATVSGTDISFLALGCSRVGSFNNTAPMAQVRATLAGALDAGVNVFDTANVYGQGDSEREIGRAVRSRRDEAFVITKLGKSFSTKMRLLGPLKPILKPLIGRRATAMRGSSISRNYDPGRFSEALDASLRRLGFDHVDGLMLHSPSASDLAHPALPEAVATLRRSGKVRYFGVSCDDLPALEAALAIPGVQLLQLPLDVIDQAHARGLTATLREREIAIFAREVIALQPGVPPEEAVANAKARDMVACVVAGTSRLEHLRSLSQAIEKTGQATPASR